MTTRSSLSPSPNRSCNHARVYFGQVPDQSHLISAIKVQPSSTSDSVLRPLEKASKVYMLSHGFNTYDPPRKAI